MQGEKRTKAVESLNYSGRVRVISYEARKGLLHHLREIVKEGA